MEILNYGTILRRYVHGADFGADDPLVAYEGAGLGTTVRRNLHADPRGSIVLVTNATGAIIRKLSYDEYGMPGTTNNTGTMEGRRFQYTGQLYLPDLGMYHYKARIYSPVLGRFLQTDPIGYEDQVNLYAYVGNDPVNGVDPTGMDDVFIGLFGRPLAVGGHAYVVLHNQTTGEIIIVQGGPNPAYTVIYGDIVSNNTQQGPSGGDKVIYGQVVPLANAGLDNLKKSEGNEFISGQVQEDAQWGEIVESAQITNDDINAAGTSYRPQTTNSNRFAGDVFETLTGQEASDDDAQRSYPGLEDEDLPRCSTSDRKC